MIQILFLSLTCVCIVTFLISRKADPLLATKIYRKVEVQLHLLTSALDGKVVSF